MGYKRRRHVFRCRCLRSLVSNFGTLVQQLQPSRYVQTAAMKRGIEMEGRAAFIYASKEKKGMANVYPCGLVINPKCPWLGSSPDRTVYDIEAAQNGSSEGVRSFDAVSYLKRDPVTNELRLKENHIYYL